MWAASFQDLLTFFFACFTGFLLPVPPPVDAARVTAGLMQICAGSKGALLPPPPLPNPPPAAQENCSPQDALNGDTGCRAHGRGDRGPDPVCRRAAAAGSRVRHDHHDHTGCLHASRCRSRRSARRDH